MRSGTGALRVCILNSPASVSTLTKETAVANRAAAHAPPHLRKLFFASQARMLDQTSNAAVAISATKLMTALITLEHAKLNRVFADPDYPLASQDSQIDLDPGERMSVHDLLLVIGNHPDFLEIDAQRSQKTGDMAGIGVLGAAGQDFVADYQRSSRLGRLLVRRLLGLFHGLFTVPHYEGVENRPISHTLAP